MTLNKTELYKVWANMIKISYYYWGTTDIADNSAGAKSTVCQMHSNTGFKSVPLVKTSLHNSYEIVATYARNKIKERVKEK
mmetsp:Transcript_146/g.209  ORF Transcript_146/g.209 Transcript_146/m.209 type:complete len:81 (-) Transcript_146:1469-1711(-)